MAIICAAVMLASIGSANAQRFINHGNGTITDTSSGLMWAQNSNLAGQTLTHSEAVAFVDSLTLYSDWRLPSRNDFTSLFANAPNSDFFAMLTSAGFTGQWYANTYWTSEFVPAPVIPVGGYYRYLLRFRIEFNPIRYEYYTHQSGPACVWPVRGTTATKTIRLGGDLAFGDVTVGSSATRTLTIYNDGNSTLTVSSISYPSGFSGSWSGTIAAGASRDVTVTFAPAAAQNYSGSLTVNSDKTSGTNTRAVSGTGYSPTRVIRLSGDISFGGIVVGQTAARTLTIYNDGNTTLTVSSISYPSGFSGNWSGTIAAGGSRNVTVTFAPAEVRLYSGNLTVNSDASSGSNTRPVSGAGEAISRIVSLSGNLLFGDVLVGNQASAILTIHNAGNSALNVTGISYPSGFSGAWSGAVSPGGSQNVTVTFAPSAAQIFVGDIVVNCDSMSGENSISASGAGLAVVSSIRLSGDLFFGSVLLGSNQSQVLSIHNDGNVPIQVVQITCPAGYAGNWNGEIPPQGHQDVAVIFTPVAVGVNEGEIQVDSDAVSGNSVIACRGIGQEYIWELNPSRFAVQLMGASGTMYYLERTLSLTGIWERCELPIYSLGEHLTITNDPARATSLFYRVACVPNADIFPPGLISNFRATTVPDSIILGWTLPPDDDFAGVRILRKTTGYSDDIYDGTLIYEGGGTTTVDQVHAPGVETNYYSAFTFDNIPNYSARVITNAAVLRTVTVIPPVNGSIIPSSTFAVNNGASWGFTAAPNQGYMVDRWYVNGVQQSSTNSFFSLINIRADTSIEVRFKVQPRFTVSGADVIDNTTGLTWKKDAALYAEMNWATAKTTAAQAGRRLPTRGELLSLYPLPSGHPFLNIYNTYYWTIENGDTSSLVWCINVQTGQSMVRSSITTGRAWLVK